MAVCTIQFENVSLSLNERKLLNGVSLDIQKQRVGVIGRNGSGKTSFARLISGLLAPSSGRVRVNGNDLFKHRAAALKTVGILFQNPDHQIIFPTVLEELSFGLTQQGQRKAEAIQNATKILQQFDRLDWAERTIATLSQGQRHLVCLLSVLAMAPPLLVLDEPFAGLDLPTKTYLQNLLDGLDQSVLHITHDLQALAEYERVIWLEKGQVVGDGFPKHIIPAFENAMAQIEQI
ncbi:energy-coupling factor ABC transporter ATP-binding protein [Paracoccaceae bacterium]|nr:energy-coupling factor ABC transporter ATP-binding protein [Paracoccaceae bacterium]